MCFIFLSGVVIVVCVSKIVVVRVKSFVVMVEYLRVVVKVSLVVNRVVSYVRIKLRVFRCVCLRKRKLLILIIFL